LIGSGRKELIRDQGSGGGGRTTASPFLRGRRQWLDDLIARIRGILKKREPWGGVGGGGDSYGLGRRRKREEETKTRGLK